MSRDIRNQPRFDIFVRVVIVRCVVGKEIQRAKELKRVLAYK
jgi:hypothetical protein